MRDVKGKNVLITGAASGIGAATAERFAREGARVIIADIQHELGGAIAKKLGPQHAFVPLDVSNALEWHTLADELRETDILILNAGVTTRPYGAKQGDDPLNWIRPEHLERVFGVNVGGVVYGIAAFLPKLRNRQNATIMVASSSAGLRPFKEDPLYVLTKYALVGLVGSLGPSLAQLGVRIVCVCPTSILTPAVAPDTAAEVKGRLAQPSVMADAYWEIFQKAEAGETWVGGGNTETKRHETPLPIPFKESSKIVYAAAEGKSR